MIIIILWNMTNCKNYAWVVFEIINLKTLKDSSLHFKHLSEITSAELVFGWKMPPPHLSQ